LSPVLQYGTRQSLIDGHNNAPTAPALIRTSRAQCLRLLSYGTA